MSGRIKAQLSTVVNRPPEDVFAYLADVSKHAEWSPKAYRVEGLDGPVRLGHDVHVVRLGPEGRRPSQRRRGHGVRRARTIEFTGREKGEDFLNTYVLTAQGSGTRIDRTLDFPKPDGIGGAFFPLVLGGFIKPATNKGMKMLKANLENGTS